MSANERNLRPVNLPENWNPGSWRLRPALQMPSYPDAAELAGVQDELRALPPLVTSWEVQALRQQLAVAQDGRRFLLQGGDCAENFSDCSSAVISNRLKVLWWDRNGYCLLYKRLHRARFELPCSGAAAKGSLRIDARALAELIRGIDRTVKR